jgi:hypothetical protein
MPPSGVLAKSVMSSPKLGFSRAGHRRVLPGRTALHGAGKAAAQFGLRNRDLDFAAQHQRRDVQRRLQALRRQGHAQVAHAHAAIPPHADCAVAVVGIAAQRHIRIDARAQQRERTQGPAHRADRLVVDRHRIGLATPERALDFSQLHRSDAIADEIGGDARRQEGEDADRDQQQDDEEGDQFEQEFHALCSKVRDRSRDC